MRQQEHRYQKTQNLINPSEGISRNKFGIIYTVYTMRIESTLDVLINRRIRDGLDQLQNVFAPFLNLFDASK